MVLQQEIVVDHPPVIYLAIKLIAVGKYICPVPRCGGEASTKWNFRRHFLDRHPQDLVYLPSKGTDSPPSQVQEMWNADKSWSPLQITPAHPTLPRRVGQESATCGCGDC